MKKIVILFSLFLLIGCNREIVLRKNQNMVAPFNEKIFPKGAYEFYLYKLDYPKELKDKQVFFNDLNILLKKYYLGDRKINLLISDEFFSDLESLRRDALLSEERIFDRQASLLGEEEVNFLLNNSARRIEKFRGTTQEYLNLQVEYLLRFLEREESFDENKIYSEREKSELIDDIKENRRENIKLLDEVSIEFVLAIDNPYELGNDSIYWDNREINLRNSNNLSKGLNNYNLPILIKNLKEKDIESLIKEEYRISNRAVFIENEVYEGYKALDNSFIFFIGGNRKIKSYEKYEFSFKIVEIKLEDMLSIKNQWTISDVLGGKK